MNNSIINLKVTLILIGIVLSVSGGFFQLYSSSLSKNSKFLGSQTCETSGCHGGAGPMSRQYTIWFRADPHSKGYNTLNSSRSKRMAEALKIENPATDLSCTSCHAPFVEVPGDLLSKTVNFQEGISCESCHGAAEKWIRSHTRPDYTHEMRVASGMRDLEDLMIRSNTCVACHQVISEEIIKSGHPPLHFELEKLCREQPRHWKEIYPGSQAWIVGQATALRELSASLMLENKDQSQEEKKGFLWQEWESVYRLLFSLNREMGKLDQEKKIIFEEIKKEKIKLNDVFLKSDRLAKLLAKENWKPVRSERLLYALLKIGVLDGQKEQMTELERQNYYRKIILGIDQCFDSYFSGENKQNIQAKGKLKELILLVEKPEMFEEEEFMDLFGKFRSMEIWKLKQ